MGTFRIDLPGHGNIHQERRDAGNHQYQVETHYSSGPTASGAGTLEVLTLLFKCNGGVLSAEYRPQTSFPILYRSGVYADHEGLFRNWLACLSSHYMDGEVYGGAALKQLSQGKQRLKARFFMSNDLHTGFWLRIFAWVEASRR